MQLTGLIIAKMKDNIQETPTKREIYIGLLHKREGSI
jgi:hypothetical protein